MSSEVLPIDIQAAFGAGRGIEIVVADRERTHTALKRLGNAALAYFPGEPAFAWTPKAEGQRPKRHSCWLVARHGEEGFVTDLEALRQFDGDPTAGERGLAILGVKELRSDLAHIKGVGDRAISAAVSCLNLPSGFVAECTTRYRLAHYPSPDGGIGTHFDGNAVSAVITNARGLEELRYDGTRHMADPAMVSIMPGSALHRASRSSPVPILPTFHRVKVTNNPAEDGGGKTSMAVFWNFPDDATVPLEFLGTAFHNDIGAMKRDDGPDGSLGHLWQRIADAQAVSIDALRRGAF